MLKRKLPDLLSNTELKKRRENTRELNKKRD